MSFQTAALLGGPSARASCFSSRRLAVDASSHSPFAAQAARPRWKAKPPRACISSPFPDPVPQLISPPAFQGRPRWPHALRKLHFSPFQWDAAFAFPEFSIKWEVESPTTTAFSGGVGRRLVGKRPASSSPPVGQSQSGLRLSAVRLRQVPGASRMRWSFVAPLPAPASDWRDLFRYPKHNPASGEQLDWLRQTPLSG